MADKSPPVTASLGFGLMPRVKSSKRAHDEQPPTTARRPRILLVEPDPESRRFLQTRLAGERYTLETVDNAAEALDACVRSRPNLVISDLRLGGELDGLKLLKELKSRWPPLMVIIVTAHGTIREAVEATQHGAFGFLVRPLERAELLGQVERAIAGSTFTHAEGDWRAQIVSRSQLMEDRLGLANRAAASDAPVLLTGENGTGKELLARAIHAASPRRDQPFVAVRCRGAAHDSLALDLFGARFAGRRDDLPSGALDAARGGSLLIDEVGDLSPALQTELIAVLGKAPLPVGNLPARRATRARLISTTSLDLKKMVEDGVFRRDLYDRINVLPIEIPPLGRRREDIPLLVSHFLEQATDETGNKKKIYSADAIELLATTDWPGNVRELFELVKQNVGLSHASVMSKDFVARSLGERPRSLPTYDEARDEFARGYLKTNLQMTAGNISQAARLAKRNRTDFYKLLARYRLEPADFKKTSEDP